eukprot:CAMPEP_0184545062 /NCGR_PEP_ID=MMETSP0199_2-20130426/4041_1 /TAXON_ID=1112570 /ORGANISM="Thraustochytrium sp., Strain LLF1b" /LENGTH=629 /DNA_ID=CAMNT_0026939315 /DNA_START=9 /DNA_END=1898 /DNA_ORIENTATION=+
MSLAHHSCRRAAAYAAGPLPHIYGPVRSVRSGTPAAKKLAKRLLVTKTPIEDEFAKKKLRATPMPEDQIDTFEKRVHEFSIDRSGLVNVPVRETEAYEYDKPQKGVPVLKSAHTPLVDELAMRILARGPLTTSEFMTVALGHPIHGYYMRRDVFGADGDFTTSPEISQVFGELIGIWCVANWMGLGSPDRVRLVEMGPGRGTLMSDILRAASNFPGFVKALEGGGGIRMVETSPALRYVQQETLQCTMLDGSPVASYGAPIRPKTPQIYKNKPKAAERAPKVDIPPPLTGVHSDDEWEISRNAGRLHMRAPLADPQGDVKSLEVEWFREFGDACPKHQEDIPVLIVAQELLDALPIHQFELSKEKVWVERMVDVDPAEATIPADTPEEDLPETLEKRHHFRFVLSKGSTPAAKVLLDEDMRTNPIGEPGDMVEVSAVAASVIEQVSSTLATSRGAALFVDYGTNGPANNSLRGIKGHKFVHPLMEPGMVDLSADVDFAFASRIVKYTDELMQSERSQKSYHHLAVSGPVSQGDFLRNMEVESRVAQLLSNTTDEDEQLNIYSSFQRLVNSTYVHPVSGEEHEGMGESYMAIAVSAGIDPELVPGFPTPAPTTGDPNQAHDNVDIPSKLA